MDKNNLTVFCFHEVNDKPSQFCKDFNLNVSPNLFVKQIKWIQEKYYIISPNDLINNNSITEPINEPITTPITTPKPNTKPELINETTQTKPELINETIQTKDATKEATKDNNIDKNKEEKESLTVIGFYLINQGHTINKDNYKSINITEYVNLFTRTLSKCILNKKLEKTNINKNKYKIINIEIPGDIMSFLKINATHSDIDDIIKIAYNVTLTNLE